MKAKSVTNATVQDFVDALADLGNTRDALSSYFHHEVEFLSWVLSLPDAEIRAHLSARLRRLLTDRLTG